MADLVEVLLSIVALIIMTSPGIAFEQYSEYFPSAFRMSIEPNAWVNTPESYAVRSAAQTDMGAGNPFLARESQHLLPVANPEPHPIAAAAPPFSEAQAPAENFNATQAILDLLRSWGLQDEHTEPDAARSSRKGLDYDYGSNAFGYAGAPHDYWTPHVDYSYAPAPHPYPPVIDYQHPTIELYKPVLPKPIIPKPILPALPTKPLVQNSISTTPTVSTSSKLSLLQLLLQLAPTFLGLSTGSGATTAASTGASGILGKLSNVLTALFSVRPALKAAIGKVVIPIVVLVLVNIEILALIWWLWEECPAPASAPASVPAPAPVHTYDYKTYYGPAPYQPQSSYNY